MMEQINAARTKVNQANEKLDLLIGLYRKQLKNKNLEFMSVSGTTHLIEVIKLYWFRCCFMIYIRLLLDITLTAVATR